MKIAQSDKVATLTLLSLATQERSTRLTGDELTGERGRVEILSTGKDALVAADQSRQDSAGQLSRVSNLSVQIHLTASFVEGGRPLRSADRQNQARSDQQGRTHLRPVSPLVKTADIQSHPYLARPSAVLTGFRLSW